MADFKGYIPTKLHMPATVELLTKPGVPVVSRLSGGEYIIVGQHQTQAHMFWCVCVEPLHPDRKGVSLTSTPMHVMDLVLDLDKDEAADRVARVCWKKLTGLEPDECPHIAMIGKPTYHLGSGGRAMDTGVQALDQRGRRDALRTIGMLLLVGGQTP